MKSFIIKSVFAFALVGIFLTGCSNSDEYNNSVSECIDPALTANKSVADIVAFANAAPTSPALYTGDDIIEAYVTSSDEKGNIYKTISFQTLPTDGSDPIGFSVTINLNSTFALGYTPGKKVYIKLKGLYVDIVYGSLQIGELYQPTPSDAPEVGRISELTYKNYLFPSCTEVAEESLVRVLSLDEAYADANLNTLIEIEDVRFVDASVGRTYYDIDSGGGATNHFITPNSGGASEIIRFSSFAPFSGNRVPGGVGKIRGVMTKYQDDYQFMVRYETDIMLGASRDFTFSGTLSENFESYVSNQDNFPNYINDPVIGNKSWSIKTSATKYIEMTSFNTGESNRTLFFVPVDFTAANDFTFQYKVSFLSTGHTPLKVYYTTNYVHGQDISTATLVNITSGFSGLSSQTATSFTTAGTYNFPTELTGNGFVIFEYTGSNSNPTHTTNLGIDNIVIN